MQAEINRLQEEIAALGPVNLAALQELQQGLDTRVFGYGSSLTRFLKPRDGGPRSQRCTRVMP